MQIKIPLALGHQVYQLNVRQKFAFFGFPVSEIFSNELVYVVKTPKELAKRNDLVGRITAQHGRFLEQMSNGKKWTIEIDEIKENE